MNSHCNKNHFDQEELYAQNSFCKITMDLRSSIDTEARILSL